MNTEIITQIAQYIGSLGFPIVACYFLYKLITDMLQKMGDKLERNTEALNKIADKLDMVKIVEGDEN
jgi:hypothetical protein